MSYSRTLQRAIDEQALKRALAAIRKREARKSNPHNVVPPTITVNVEHKEERTGALDIVKGLAK